MPNFMKIVVMETLDHVIIFYVIINAEQLNQSCSKHHKVGDVVDAPVDIVYIKNKRLLYHSSAIGNNSDSSVTDVH